MTELMRVKARWSGFSGAPGYTVLHFRDFGAGDGGGGSVSLASATAAAGRVRQFFDSIKAMLPASVDINVESEVDVLEDTTGELVNSLNVPTVAQVDGLSTGPYSAASGAVVNWRTGGIRNGRRIRGRSFIVPIVGSYFTTSGALAGSAAGDIQTAAAALANSTSSPDLMVYARPTSKGASDGTAAVVTGTNVPSFAAVLRSRRD